MALGGAAKVGVPTLFVPSAAETVTLAGDGTLGALLRAHLMDGTGCGCRRSGRGSTIRWRGFWRFVSGMF